MSQFTLAMEVAPLIETGDRRTGSLAPIQPLKLRQRLGYFDQVKSAECVVSMPGFEAGNSYEVRTSTIRAYRWGEKTSVEGHIEQVEWTSNEMAIFLIDCYGVPRCFVDEKFLKGKVHIGDGTVPEYGFDALLNHFTAPEVKDLAQLFPERYAENLKRLKELESFIALNRKE